MISGLFTISHESDLIMVFYKKSFSKKLLTIILTIFSFGLYWLIRKSNFQLYIQTIASICDPISADYVHIKKNSKYFLLPITAVEIDIKIDDDIIISIDDDSKECLDETKCLITKKKSVVKYFEFENIRYVYNKSMNKYCHFQGIDFYAYLRKNVSIEISFYTRLFRQIIFGKNVYSIKINSYYKLFKDHLINPFFIFQFLCLVLWFTDEYYSYAIFVLVILIRDLIKDIFETKQRENSFNNIMSIDPYDIKILQNDVEQIMKSFELVPGDIISIPSSGFVCPCDIILLTGSTIINEVNITGISTPVTKSSFTCSSKNMILKNSKQKLRYNKLIPLPSEKPKNYITGSTKFNIFESDVLDAVHEALLTDSSMMEMIDCEDDFRPSSNIINKSMKYEKDCIKKQLNEELNFNLSEYILLDSSKNQNIAFNLSIDDDLRFKENVIINNACKQSIFENNSKIKTNLIIDPMIYNSNFDLKQNNKPMVSISNTSNYLSHKHLPEIIVQKYDINIEEKLNKSLANKNTQSLIAYKNRACYFNIEDYNENIVFAGTNVLQTRFYGSSQVEALVIRTGYNTVKGKTIRSVIYPKDVLSSFDTDALKFLFILSTVSLVGAAAVMYLLIINQARISTIIIRALDIITIVVPPTLPTALTMCAAYTQGKLYKKKIFSTHTQRVALSGQIDFICFDQIDTLVKQKPSIAFILQVKNRSFLPKVTSVKCLKISDLMIIGMATCHTLTFIDGKLSGDATELEIFNSIDWTMEEMGKDENKYDLLIQTIVRPILIQEPNDFDFGFEIGIIRQFVSEFSSPMTTVITRKLGDPNMRVFIKGSPNNILPLCHKNTLPDNLKINLDKFSHQGYHVIAMATKKLPRSMTWQVHRMNRNEFEHNLQFLGLICLNNVLKPETVPAIFRLLNADLQCVLFTSENSWTALSVSRQCNLINTFDWIINIKTEINDKEAIVKWDCLDDNNENFGNLNPKIILTGTDFCIIEEKFPKLLPEILNICVIYSQIQPIQKTRIITALQKYGKHICICSNGTRDLSALHSSHVGVVLSQPKTSYVSHIVTTCDNITCLIDIIKEGRASLVAAFSMIKYMMLYSFIQFISVIILLFYNTKLQDFMYLYIDLFIVYTLATSMCRSSAGNILIKNRPNSKLSSHINILNILFHIFISCFFQILAIILLHSQKWYKSPEGNIDYDVPSMDATCIFSISSFQYIITAFIFTKGSPFQMPKWRNYTFMTSIIILIIINIIYTFLPADLIFKIFKTQPIPSMEFKIVIILLIISNFMIAYIFEKIVFDCILSKLDNKKNLTKKLKINWSKSGSLILKLDNCLN